MDTRTIAKLAEIMGQHSLSDLEVEEQGLHVHLRRSVCCSVESVAVSAPVVSSKVPAASVSAQHLAEAERPVASGCSDVITITSPLVGTYYASSSPDTEPFVHEGSVVKPGMTLCIIEAMKVMNEVKAEQGGVVTKILVPNKTTVEYGSALFELKAE